jgi:uncharacterized protein YllA (UPF0747 family)
MNRFVLEWLHGEPKATCFLPRDTRPPQPSRRNVSPALVQALIDSNQRWGLSASDDLRRWAGGETVTIVAGQQVGFAGGPLYTIAKLATLIRWKRALQAQGIPVTAFFWLATEDHDFSEVATLNVLVPGRQQDLLCLRASRGVDDRATVGSLPVPETLIEELLALQSMERPRYFRPGITFRDSFAELMTAVAGNDVVLIDALLPELRREGAPLFEAIVRNRDGLQRLIADRSAEMQRAGYAPQVVPRDGEPYTLLFQLDAENRRQLDHVDLSRPERISTSALTRPLLQDLVFRPDIVVGGPAEVAYYAQITPLHERLNVPMPRVALRGHALVAPKRVVRLLERFDMNPCEIFTSPDALLTEREPEGVAEVKKIADEARRELAEKITRIGDIALPAEHALARAISRSIGHIEYHFDRLAERAIRGVVRKDRERYAAVKELVSTFYPDRHVQDRIVAWYPFWCQYGNHLLEQLVENIEPDAAEFSIVSL